MICAVFRSISAAFTDVCALLPGPCLLPSEDHGFGVCLFYARHRWSKSTACTGVMFPPSPPGVLLLWTCFNISCCTYVHIPTHGTHMQVTGDVQVVCVCDKFVCAWRRRRSVCVCVCVHMCSCSQTSHQQNTDSCSDHLLVFMDCLEMNQLWIVRV